ncbi:hypothetical protein AVEN_136275-1 [Araneus ventricosus]|uniref:Uncharacterized protein n=1 Tax=Araneus ventricosus TaxID=182803 RepID=A0A4Y2L626_ARAVE|nr:hypothetical protein AVEN_136275-1 [Araneus ventricosus]
MSRGVGFEKYGLVIWILRFQPYQTCLALPTEAIGYSKSLKQPEAVYELNEGLIRVWSTLPIQVTDNLILRMEKLWQERASVRGGHI